MSDKNFAKQMAALQTNGQPPSGESSESSESSESEWDYDSSKSSKNWKRLTHFKESVKYFDLSPRDFERCDINILDGLEIKGWKKFKAKLENYGIGE
jgi:hypothetical protein